MRLVVVVVILFPEEYTKHMHNIITVISQNVFLWRLREKLRDSSSWQPHLPSCMLKQTGACQYPCTGHSMYASRIDKTCMRCQLRGVCSIYHGLVKPFTYTLRLELEILRSDGSCNMVIISTVLISWYMYMFCVSFWFNKIRFIYSYMHTRLIWFIYFRANNYLIYIVCKVYVLCVQMLPGNIISPHCSWETNMRQVLNNRASGLVLLFTWWVSEALIVTLLWHVG